MTETMGSVPSAGVKTGMHSRSGGRRCKVILLSYKEEGEGGRDRDTQKEMGGVSFPPSAAPAVPTLSPCGSWAAQSGVDQVNGPSRLESVASLGCVLVALTNSSDRDLGRRCLSSSRSLGHVCCASSRRDSPSLSTSGQAGTLLSVQCVCDC